MEKTFADISINCYCFFPANFSTQWLSLFFRVTKKIRSFVCLSVTEFAKTILNGTRFEIQIYRTLRYV